eukprot:1954354-Karenia_brevis.AAC.1
MKTWSSDRSSRASPDNFSELGCRCACYNLRVAVLSALVSGGAYLQDASGNELAAQNQYGILGRHRQRRTHELHTGCCASNACVSRELLLMKNSSPDCKDGKSAAPQG